MEVWILYGDDIESNADLAHEARRFLKEGERMEVDVKIIKPSDFDLLVTQDSRDSILIKGKAVPLPDFVFPYFNHHDQGYFSLAIVRQLSDDARQAVGKGWPAPLARATGPQRPAATAVHSTDELPVGHHAVPGRVKRVDELLHLLGRRSQTNLSKCALELGAGDASRAIAVEA